jgi:hypothetical protein
MIKINLKPVVVMVVAQVYMENRGDKRKNSHSDFSTWHLLLLLLEEESWFHDITQPLTLRVFVGKSNIANPYYSKSRTKRIRAMTAAVAATTLGVYRCVVLRISVAYDQYWSLLHLLWSVTTNQVMGRRAMSLYVWTDEPWRRKSTTGFNPRRSTSNTRSTTWHDPQQASYKYLYIYGEPIMAWYTRLLFKHSKTKSNKHRMPKRIKGDRTREAHTDPRGVIQQPLHCAWGVPLTPSASCTPWCPLSPSSVALVLLLLLMHSHASSSTCVVDPVLLLCVPLAWLLLGQSSSSPPLWAPPWCPLPTAGRALPHLRIDLVPAVGLAQSPYRSSPHLVPPAIPPTPPPGLEDHGAHMQGWERVCQNTHRSSMSPPCTVGCAIVAQQHTSTLTI